MRNRAFESSHMSHCKHLFFDCCSLAQGWIRHLFEGQLAHVATGERHRIQAELRPKTPLAEVQAKNLTPIAP